MKPGGPQLCHPIAHRPRVRHSAECVLEPGKINSLIHQHMASMTLFDWGYGGYVEIVSHWHWNLLMFLYITLLETRIEAYGKLSDQDIELSSTPPLQDPTRSLIPLAPPLLMYTAPALHRVAEPNGCIPLYTIVLYIRYQYIMIFHYISLYH